MKFDLALIDPPWSYYGDPNKMGAAGKEYSLMSLEEIERLPVADLLFRSGAALVWSTSPRLHYAIKAIESWGLHYRGVAFVWIKTRKDGAIIHGQGVRPTFTKPTTEYVLLATRRPRGRPFALMTEAAPQVILAPRGRHSEKPAAVREWIEKIVPKGAAKVEIFARETSPGWVCLGNEIDGIDMQDALWALQTLRGPERSTVGK